MPLTEQEKVQVRHHLGYMNVKESQTFVLGFPAGVQTQFMIEGAMNKVLEDAMHQLRRHVAILDKIESQMVDDQELLSVQSVDEIVINPEEMNKLRKEYQHWRKGLANLLGIVPNPYDGRFAGRSMNVSVIR